MTAVLPEQGVVVEQPGVYDIPDDVYHADPVPSGSLSASGAKLLLPPSCPARFRYQRDNPPAPKPVFDLGHAAHKLVLGAGPEFVIVNANDWQTKAAQTARKEAHAAGKVPLLTAEHDRVKAMAAALHEHPIAAALLNPAYGRPEQSLFWTDQSTGVQCRARLDWLPNRVPGQRFIASDYKTTTSAVPNDLGRTVHNLRYHLSAAWYLDGVKALGLDDDPAFVLIFQEKDPPYLVTVVQLDRTAERIGRELGRRALDIYRRCTATDHWPGYTDDIELIALPAWAERNHEETS